MTKTAIGNSSNNNSYPDHDCAVTALMRGKQNINEENYEHVAMITNKMLLKFTTNLISFSQ